MVMVNIANQFQTDYFASKGNPYCFLVQKAISSCIYKNQQLVLMLRTVLILKGSKELLQRSLLRLITLQQVFKPFEVDQYSSILAIM